MIAGPLLRYAGLTRPYRFERALPAILAVLLASVVFASAMSLHSDDQLNFNSPRGAHFAYLLGLSIAVVATLRWPRLAGALTVLATIEVALGVAGRLMFGNPPLPDNATSAQRFRWHILLQATPVPSLAVVTANRKSFEHSTDGTRGRTWTPQDLASRKVIAVFGGSSTYDIGVSEGETWSDRLEQALGASNVAVINHGVPGYSTVEHIIQTAFYQNKFGMPPVCAVYYVGWNDIRNAHFRNLDQAYADFHLPSQVDSLRTRRLGGAHVSISPALTVLGQFVSALADTVQYSWTLSGEVKSSTDPALEAMFVRNVRTISAINRERGVKTVWIGQLVNRDRLKGDGMYGWLPYVRDRDVWTLQSRFNALLRDTARDLSDIHVDADIHAFGANDFVDQGHFSAPGAIKFASRVAPAIREACR